MHVFPFQNWPAEQVPALEVEVVVVVVVEVADPVPETDAPQAQV